MSFKGSRSSHVLSVVSAQLRTMGMSATSWENCTIADSRFYKGTPVLRFAFSSLLFEVQLALHLQSPGMIRYQLVLVSADIFLYQCTCCAVGHAIFEGCIRYPSFLYLKLTHPTPLSGPTVFPVPWAAELKHQDPRYCTRCDCGAHGDETGRSASHQSSVKNGEPCQSHGNMCVTYVISITRLA